MTALVWAWLAVAAVLAAGTVVLSRWLMFRDAREAQRAAALLEPESADDPQRGRPRPWVIVNPSKHDDPAAFREEVDALAADRGIPHVHWIETTPDDPGTGQALRAVELGASVVIAAGGDGTVRAVAAGMAHTGVRMGILPVGTGNLLARNLGLPLSDTAAALGIALGDTHQAVDLAWLRVEDADERSSLPAEGGLVADAGAPSIRPLPEGLAEPRPDEYAFVVIAGLGFDGETMAGTDPDLKKKVGWAAYVLSAFKALRARRVHARVSLRGAAPVPEEDADRADEAGAAGRGSSPDPAPRGDGGEDGDGSPLLTEDSEFTARTVMFANCSDLPYIVLVPDASLNDGLLDVVAVDTQAGVLGWANLSRKVLLQGAGVPADNLPTGLGSIDFRQARGATVTVDAPEVVQVDGDAIGSARTVHARVDAGALDVSVPAPSVTAV
jgi:diacylglycerol kinase family enzyme